MIILAKKLCFVKYPEQVEEEKVIDRGENFKKELKFSDKGIYSSVIFGDYYAEKNDISAKGWIKLNHKLISPLLFLMMKKKKLIDEEILSSEIEKIEDDPTEFFMSQKNSKNIEMIDFLLKNKDKILIDKIPVFSHKLRPITVIGQKIIYDKINSNFGLLVQYNNNLKYNDVEKEFDIDILLKNMQENIAQIILKIIEKLKGKKGILRKEVFAAKLNFSARNVITPLANVNYNIDDVAIPYLTALELYKYQIINILSKVKRVNYNRALNIWTMAQLKLDPEVYEIMEMLRLNTKGGLKILLNRNPTISIGSIMELNVVKIKNDYSDLTLSLSNNLLNAFSGDYDGDVLNIISLVDEYLKDTFSLFSPENLIVNKNDGKFDTRFSFTKEQNLGIFNLNNN